MNNTSNHSVINLSLELNTCVPQNVENKETETSKLPGRKPIHMISISVNLNVDCKFTDVILSDNMRKMRKYYVRVKIITPMLTLNHYVILLGSSANIPHMCALWESTRFQAGMNLSYIVIIMLFSGSSWMKRWAALSQGGLTEHLSFLPSHLSEDHAKCAIAFIEEQDRLGFTSYRMGNTDH